MSTEDRAAATRLSSEGTGTGTTTANLEQQQQLQQHEHAISSLAPNTPEEGTDASITTSTRESQGENVPILASGASPTVAGFEVTDSGESTRQVIAVSASKSPAAFFNLARKFLVTNEMCDLSALEGAIVSAVDAAHLLERSQLATIVRIHTSYVSVEPKRKKSSSQPGEQDILLIQPSPSPPTGLEVGGEVVAASTASDSYAAGVGRASGGEPEGQTHPLPASSPNPPSATTGTQSSRRGSSGGRELRRARIVVTVRRTESYKRWLEENPLQAIIASEADDEAEETMETPRQTGSPIIP